MEEEIRKVISEVPKLREIVPQLAAGGDLWDAGMDSMTSVQMMLRLEDHYGVEFPDGSLTRDTFASIRSLGTVLAPLLEERKATTG
ncbi:acyl carrier protein [Streptomyces sp. NBC_01264]|uniref:acyl carrier protein n=1 Tax=Streptomyces sp. NBC_01264 TaxID=2903804 RepID=UPI0022539594|nr:acyl carrier protein [Streptomyces sp. NBC_01264]MCX4778465.1 acyl carrier protein [Streptomyces sp. NBC_01264]